MQVVNSLLDSGFIGHLPPSALVAYGGVTNVVFLLFSLAMAMATGATALVSRAFGAGEPEEYRRACRQALSLSILCGFVFGAIGIATAGLAAKLFLPGDQVEAMRLMERYIWIFSLGLPAIYLIQALAASMRGIGDTRSPMAISGLQILLHIGLNYLLIFPPSRIGSLTIPGANLGLLGAASALCISSWVAAVGYLLYTGRTPLGVCWRLQMPQVEWATRIFRIAVPAALMALLRVASLAAFTVVLKFAPKGASAIAAMRPGFAIESMMFMPSFGLSMAAAALVGQSLGMKDPERAERLAWTAAHMAALITLAVSLPVFLTADSIANVLIAGKPEIAAEAASLLRWLCVTEVGFAYAMVFLGAMQGAGDTVRPMWITVFALWGLRVPATWLLVLPVGLGATGAWIAMSGTQMVQGALSMAAFRQGSWKSKEV